MIGDSFNSNKYGEFTVIGRAGCKFVCEFKDTGYVTTAYKNNIVNGSVKDKLLPSVHGVGFVGVGDHKASDNGKDTIEYSIWSKMMTRCYSDVYHATRPTYIGCAVCSEWHNFQSFAEWMKKNYPSDGAPYDLDKDILGSGSKTYSPETCKFVSKRENAIKAAEHRMKEYTVMDSFGVLHTFNNISSFAKENSMSYSSLQRLTSGKVGSYKGWKLI